MSSKTKEKRPSVSTQVVGADFTPLLIGKVQLHNIHNLQRELLIEEIFLRIIVAPSNKKITALKHHLIADEHKDQTVDDKTKKHFMPKLLTAAE